MKLLVYVDRYQHSFEQVPVTLIILAIFEVNASNIVEGWAQFLFIVQLSEDLCYFMVIQKGLVVVTNVHRDPCYFYGLRQVTEGVV